MSQLSEKTCTPCEGGIAPLDLPAATALLEKIHDDWELNESGKEIRREFTFKGYYKTIAFVNAIAWIANTEGHHPDLEVSYNRCLVRYTTHAVDGLTDNDFICAAKIDELLGS